MSVFRDELADDEVRVWHVFLDAASDPALLARYRSLMSAEERARCDRYHFEHSRVEYTLTRALARTTLSRYADVDPRSWTFGANEFGCPFVSGPPGVRTPRFNLSNTRGLVACAVAWDREVGVDVEDTTRGGETVEIADRFFSPREVNDLRSLPASEHTARFFAYWTLKEAYIKARGMGLAIPLEQFSFMLDPRDSFASPGIAFDPRLGDEPARWRFARLDLSARHATAVAATIRPGESALRFVPRNVIPLVT